jgi:hypothetical protein
MAINSTLHRHAVLYAALAVLAGCAAFSPAPQLPTVAPQSRPDATHGDLLYISDLGANSVLYYTYPQGALVGTLHDFAAVETLCADKAGEIFVVDETGPVYVFAHGGTQPLRKLAGSGAPEGCAVDPATGDLAVTQQSSYLYGTVSIYPKAKGKPQTLFNNLVDATFFCGYDDKGNLFMDGWNRSGNVILLELPKGGKNIKVMELDRSIKTPAGVEWDGKYIALADKGAGAIDRLTSIGKIVQTIKLHDGAGVNQFWLQGGTLIGPNASSFGTVPFWHYPGGGAPYATIKGFYYPVGAAISL